MRKFTAMTIATLFAATCAAPALAQADKAQDKGQDKSRPQDRPGVAKVSDEAAKEFKCCTTDKLIGKPVKNTAGKDIGNLHDLALEPRSGRIVYGVLSFGGFMGFGDKLFAVPWGSFGMDKDGNLRLDVSKEQLEAAKGFDQDKWPNMADHRWAVDTHAAFGQRPYWDDPHAQGRKADAQGDRTTPTAIVRASQLTKAGIENPAGEEIGQIKNLLIDVCHGRTACALMSRGGVLGMGADTYMVPWSSFTVHQQDKNLRVESKITKEQLEGAPELVAASEYENKPVYLVQVYRFYDATPYWEHDGPSHE